MQILSSQFSPPIHFSHFKNLISPQFNQNQNEGSPLFFTSTAEDVYLHLIIHELRIADAKGRIKREFENFSLPSLDDKTISSIQKQLYQKFLIVGSRAGCPLNIPLRRIEIFRELKKCAANLGVDHSALIKYHGSEFHKNISYHYKELVFKIFFSPFQDQLSSEQQDFLYSVKETFVHSHDADYQIKPLNSSTQISEKLIECLIQTFKKNLDFYHLDFSLIASYLNKLREKANKNSYAYLKSVLNNHDEFSDYHPQLIETLIKVDGFIKASEVKSPVKGLVNENIFSLRSFGDRQENKIDVVFLTSNARNGIYAYHHLGVNIDPLLENPKNIPSLFPYVSEGNPIQFFSDNRAELLTSTHDEAYEEADFIRYILACSKGKRCLQKGKGQNCLSIMIKNAEDQETPFYLYLSAQLKKNLSHYDDKRAELLIASTFLSCHLLIEKSPDYLKEIKKIWKEIFDYIDQASLKYQKSDFISALRSALENPYLTFDHVLDQLQEGCYLSLNLACAVGIVPTNHEVPSIRIPISTYYLLIPYQPLKGVYSLQAIKEPSAWQALNHLYESFHSWVSFKQPFSLLKPYLHHPDSHFKSVKQSAIEMFENDNVSIKHQAYLRLLACFAQKAEEDSLKLLLTHLPDLKFFDTLSFLCRSSLFENLFLPEFKLYEAMHYLLFPSPDFKIESQNKGIHLLFETKQSLLIEMGLSFYKKNFHLIIIQDSFDPLKKIELLSGRHLKSAFNLAHFVDQNAKPDFRLDFDRWMKITSHYRNLEKNSLQQPRHIVLFTHLVEKLLNLLKRHDFNLENMASHQQNFTWLIEQLIEKKEFLKGEQVIFSYLKQKLGDVTPFLALQTYQVASFYLHEDSKNIVKAYLCWLEGSKYQLWNELDTHLKQEYLSKLAKEKINFSSCSTALFTPLKETKNKSVHSFLFLDYFESLLVIKPFKLDVFLSCFIPFIENNAFIACEEEDKIIQTLLKKVFEDALSPLHQEEMNILHQFLQALTIHRYSPLLNGIFLKNLKTCLKKKQYSLAVILFEASLNYLYCKNDFKLSATTYHDFFDCFNKLLNELRLSLYPLPLSLKKTLQNSQLKFLLDDLASYQLYENLLSFVIHLKHLSIELLNASDYLDVFLKNYPSFSSSTRKLLQHYIEIYIPLSAAKKADFFSFYFNLAEIATLEKNFLEAKKCLKKCEEIQKNDSLYLLVLQNGQHLLEENKISDSLEQIEILKKGLYFSDEIENQWSVFLEICFKKLPISDCLNLLLKYPFFKNKESKNYPIIEAILDKAFHVNQPSLPSSKELNVIIQLMKKIRITHQQFWIQFLYNCYYQNESTLKQEAIELLFSHQSYLSKETLKNSWRIILEGIKNQGHPLLFQLMNDKPFLEILSSLSLDLRTLFISYLIHGFHKTKKNKDKVINFSSIIEAIRMLGINAFSFSKLQDIINWCRLLLSTQEESDILEATTLILKITCDYEFLPDHSLHQTIKELLMSFLKDKITQDQHIEIIATLKKFQCSQSDYLFILNQLYLHPLECNKEKTEWIKALLKLNKITPLEMKDKKTIGRIFQQLFQNPTLSGYSLLHKKKVELILDRNDRIKCDQVTPKLYKITFCAYKAFLKNNFLGSKAHYFILAIMILYLVLSRLENHQKDKDNLILICKR